MKTDIELLEIMLLDIDDTFSGLCHLNAYLLTCGVFSPLDYGRMKEIIQENRPKNKSKKDHFFLPYLSAPRRQLLRQLLEKYSQSEK